MGAQGREGCRERGELPLRRRCLQFSVGGGAKAQDWPPRQTTIVIGFGPGSAADLLARVVAEAMQKKHGRPFIVENKPGAGGNVSVDQVVRGPFDGSVLLASIFAPIIINPLTMEGVKYDPWKQLVPLTVMGTTPSVLVASKKLGVKSMPEFRELLKANPGKYSYSSVGVGTIGHLSMEMLADQVGSKMVHVPFRSTPIRSMPSCAAMWMSRPWRSASSRRNWRRANLCLLRSHRRSAGRHSRISRPLLKPAYPTCPSTPGARSLHPPACHSRSLTS